MPLNLNYFSDSMLALAQEVGNHPHLVQRLKNHPAAEFEIKLAEIAAYCEIALDGYYTPVDIDKLCEILYNKLRSSRSALILQH